MAIGRRAAALRIPGKDNTVADALTRVSIRVRGLGPYPERELRKKRRSQVQDRCGAVDVDVMASDEGHNARGPFFRLPSNSALGAHFRAAVCGGSPESKWLT